MAGENHGEAWGRLEQKVDTVIEQTACLPDLCIKQAKLEERVESAEKAIGRAHSRIDGWGRVCLQIGGGLLVAVGAWALIEFLSGRATASIVK